MNLNLHLARRYGKIKHTFKGLINQNPVLTMGLALPFAVVCSGTLQNATILSLSMLFTVLPTLFMCNLFGKKLPTWLHMVVFPIIAALLLIPVTVFVSPLTPNISDSLGFYIQIISVNTLLLYSITPCVYMKKPMDALSYAFFNVAGFSIVVLLLAVFREALGNGTLWNIPLPYVPIKLTGLQLPFAGFILLGVLAAGCRFINRIIIQILLNLDKVRKQETDLGVSDLMD
ncbi:MAG: Rnf-Nqr domain containing protein [Oscillospiraceae bacterium]